MLRTSVVVGLASLGSMLVACGSGDVVVGIRERVAREWVWDDGGAEGSSDLGGFAAASGASDSDAPSSGGAGGSGGSAGPAGSGGQVALGGSPGSGGQTGSGGRSVGGGSIGGGSGSILVGGGADTAGRLDTGGAGSRESGAPLPSIPLDTGRYTYGDYTGYLWTAADDFGSTITGGCRNGDDCFSDTACVSGVVAQIPALPDGSAEYACWGVMIGWNLSVGSTEASTPPPVSVAGKTSISLGLANGAGLPVRVGLRVYTATSGEQTFCRNATLVNGHTTVGLDTLRAECWTGSGTSFNPATMQPSQLQIQFSAEVAASHSFENTCITDLTID